MYWTNVYGPHYFRIQDGIITFTDGRTDMIVSTKNIYQMSLERGKRGEMIVWVGGQWLGQWLVWSGGEKSDI